MARFHFCKLILTRQEARGWAGVSGGRVGVSVGGALT